MSSSDNGEDRTRAEEARRRSEERFRLLVEGVQDYAIFALDPEGKVTSWNEGARRIKGYEEEEILGKHFSAFYTQEDLERGHPEEELRIAAAQGRYEEEGLRVRKDGSRFWASVLITALRDEEGNLRGFSKVTRDITERKHAEQALRQQAELLELSYEPLLAWELDGGIVYWNRGCEELYGFSREAALGNISHQLLRTVHPIPLEEFKAVLERERNWVGELTHTTRDGRQVTVESRHVLVSAEDGRRLVLETNRDITERKLAEAKLKESEERFRLLVKGVKDYAIFMLDPEGNIVTWNLGAERIKGYGADEIIGRHFSAFYPKEDVERGKPGLELEIVKAEGTYEEEGLRVRKDGTTFWANVLITALRDEEGNLRGFSKVTRDITQQKRSQEQLRQSEERFRLLIQSSSDIVSVFDAVGTILYQSPSVEWVLGYRAEDRIGKNVFVSPLVHPEDLTSKRSFFAKARGSLGATVRAEFRLRHADGSWRYIEAVGRNMLREPSIRGIVANYRDVTERKRAEHALSEAQEAERRRIARDLHDSVLQDLVAAIRQTEVVRLVPAEDQAGDELEAATEALRRSTRGVREAIYGLHPEGSQGEGFLVRSLEALLEANHRMAPELETELVFEEGFPSQLRGEMGRELVRVVQEALNNVRRHSGARRARVALRAKEDGIEVEVSDDGRGFDPRTTPGGLGLVSMRERAAAFGGELEIQSEPGSGTRVVFRAPLPS